MLKMVDGTGIIGVDMVCPLGGAVSPPQPPNYDNVEMEGMGSLTLQNSLKAPLERLELIGNSVQGENPAPDNPKEIKSAGKWNEEKQKYEISVKVTGKNLFDESNVKKGYITVNDTIQNATELRDEVYSDYIPVVYKSVLMTLQANIPQSEQLWSAIAFYTDDKTFIKRVSYVGLTGKSELKTKVEMMENARFIRVTYRRYGNGKMMINSGETYLPYEPYTEQTLTLTSDRPITKWDRLVEQGGQYGWLYGSKIYVVTGNEVFESRDGYNIESYTNRFFILNDLLKENDALKPLAYMKCLRNVQYVYSPNIFEEGFETNINQFHIKLSNDRVGILASDDHAVRTAKFSEYMKKIHKNGNPIEILYATTDTVFLPLPQSEQTQLRNLHSYNGTTNITVDSGEVPCGIKLTYRKEI